MYAQDNNSLPVWSIFCLQLTNSYLNQSHPFLVGIVSILLDAPPGDCGSYTVLSSVSTSNLHQSSPQEPDWNALCPFFAWTSPSSIKDTFNVTTRHGTAPHTQDYIKKHFKSRNPVFNIPRCSEAVATDTIFSDTPAVDDGSTMAQFFCCRDTLVCDAYGIKSTKQFINTLSDNIRKRGAMDTLISDGGKYEISKRVTDLLCSLFIQDYQSEPYHQHQNKAENHFGLAKRYTNTVMNTSGCPACCWLLCLQYICVVLNHLASPTLQGICPVQALEGTTPDISFLLHFSFYEPVYYRIDSSEPDLNFPSSSNEKKGYWVGFADNQGDCLTWRILTEDTQKIIIRSGVRSALRTTTNQRLASPSGEGTTLPFPIPYPQQSKNSLPLDPLDESTPNFEQFVNSQSGEDEDNPIPMANIDIPNLLGRSFLLPPEDNGERHMAKIIDIDDHGQSLEDIRFKLKINKDQAEEIMSYNQLMDYIQKGTDAEEDPDSLFKFRDIVAKEANTMLWLNGSQGRSLMNLWHSFPRILIQSLVQFMPRNMIFLTQQDGNTSKDMPRLPKDSSELSNNLGFAKLEPQLDTNMVSKSQRITMML